MSYGKYSEVYIARNINERNLIKIGETSNSSRRNGQLKNYNIVYNAYMHECNPSSKAIRQFVEAYLRVYLSNDTIQTIVSQIEGTDDYFYCKDEQVADKIITELKNVIDIAHKLTEDIKRPAKHQFKDMLPHEFPENVSNIMLSIFDAVEKYGEINDECYQVKHRYRKEMYRIINNYYIPLGYKTSFNEGLAWTYFTIIK